LGLSAAGCVATISTIGGHDEAEVRQWAAQARDMCFERTGQEPPYVFTTDGCTLSPDGTWQLCCVEHDMIYWCGGSAEERRLADTRLRACVAGSGSPRIAPITYWGVRLGGSPWLPTYWRWGYGWPWPRGYTDDKRP
jgi:hypothetical protein